MNTTLSFKMIIPIFALVAASIACTIPLPGIVQEALTEKCYTVERAAYERAAAELGRTPQTPNFPESVVYEVCYFDENAGDKVSSIRMTNDYPPEENEPVEGGESISNPEGSSPDGKEQTENEAASSIPAGTYTGKFPGDLSAYNLVANEINLVVSGNGAVSGTALLHYNYTLPHNTSSGGQCTSYHEYSTLYVVGGQVKDAWTKTATVQKTLFEIKDYSNCGRESERRDETCTCEASAGIKDGVLTITCGTGVDCGAYLTSAR